MRPARQVRRNTRESRQARARREQARMWQRFAARMVDVVEALTDCARSGMALMESSAHVPFEDLDAHLQASLDGAHRALDLARDEARMALLSEDP